MVYTTNHQLVNARFLEPSTRFQPSTFSKKIPPKNRRSIMLRPLVPPRPRKHLLPEAAARGGFCLIKHFVGWRCVKGDIFWKKLVDRKLDGTKQNIFLIDGVYFLGVSVIEYYEKPLRPTDSEALRWTFVKKGMLKTYHPAADSMMAENLYARCMVIGWHGTDIHLSQSLFELMTWSNVVFPPPFATVRFISSS